MPPPALGWRGRRSGRADDARASPGHPLRGTTAAPDPLREPDHTRPVRNVAPLRTIHGSNTGFNNGPIGIAPFADGFEN